MSIIPFQLQPAATEEAVLYSSPPSYPIPMVLSNSSSSSSIFVYNNYCTSSPPPPPHQVVAAVAVYYTRARFKIQVQVYAQNRIDIMRTICDVCESAAAILFCAADEAALCRACDDKVHMCNKLASRHVRVGLADPSGVPRCDICENAPAFFYCEIDGSSLCLQCDMIVHVGGKRTHRRYLLLRQRVEFPGDKSGHPEEPTSQPLDQDDNKRIHNHTLKLSAGENQQNHRSPSVQMVDSNSHGHAKMDSKMIDLNMKPQKTHEPPSNNQM